MTNRKFYLTKINVEVLSEIPISPDSTLQDIYFFIGEGDASGSVIIHEPEVIDGKACAQQAMSQATDPEFFGIDKDGNELE